MNRLVRLRSSCVVLGALVMHVAQAVAGDSLPDVGELRSRLAETLNAYRTIVVKYRWPYLPNLIPDPRNRGEPHGPLRYVWGREGGKQFLRFTPPPEWEEQPPCHVVWTGTTSYRALQRRGLPKEVLIQSYPSRELQGAWTPDVFTGALLYNIDITLVEALALPQARVDRREVIDGTECFIVEVAGLLFNKTARCRVAAWLDSQHDYLARRVAIYDDGGSDWRKTFETREFMQIPGSDGKRKFWFPKVGAIIQMIGEYRVLFDDVRINAPFSDDDFRMDMPPGTNVVDERDAVAGPRVSLVGGFAATDDTVARLAAAARVAVGAEGEAPDATPRWGISGARLSLFAGLAAVATATAMVAVQRIRKRR